MRTLHAETLEFRLLNALVIPDKPNSGNFAPIVLVPKSDPRSNDTAWMRKIADDFAYPMVAFLVPSTDDLTEEDDGEKLEYGLRFFAPASEVPECGHATFAAADVLFKSHPKARFVRLNTLGGSLYVESTPDGPLMSLPVINIEKLSDPERNKLRFAVVDFLQKCSSITLRDVTEVSTFEFAGRSCYLIELDPGVDVGAVRIDPKALTSLSTGLIILTHIVIPECTDDILRIDSRVFAPGLGVDEDVVSGVPHALMTGYYTRYPVLLRLPGALKDKIPNDIIVSAKQLSARGGAMICRLWFGERAVIQGKNVEWARGMLL
ncbi:hypothetical protein BD324DRAFT_632650 [Kockovaella imperatae]|uniref:Diaminopimelate epimerase-like protein n=1 Tax=Kockovaella imperatae TaxID=4999 RepID=A0A1Y1UCX8_9TREE|nr:hypothetical protein BD324DRAFT_632650 [Kockovaella imperatae]ORX35397.1 hypothetical protein BD324DRAFT_632650 [Kockovaella imperatae]